ncbi:MAG: hypothetical protein M0P13_07875, partial [Fibrobacteraceae bacterium]|nr:hypothetical protein [Fibrobacteraceae bacterium]
DFNTSLAWNYLMDQVIAPLFNASVDMGKKAVVASSAATVGVLGAGTLALAAPGAVAGASAMLTGAETFVATNPSIAVKGLHIVEFSAGWLSGPGFTESPYELTGQIGGTVYNQTPKLMNAISSYFNNRLQDAIDTPYDNSSAD